MIYIYQYINLQYILIVYKYIYIFRHNVTHKNEEYLKTSAFAKNSNVSSFGFIPRREYANKINLIFYHCYKINMLLYINIKTVCI